MRQRATVTSKGQVTVPEAVCRALGAREGDSLLFEVDAGGARVSVERKPESFADYAGIWREGEGMSRDEVNASVRELRGLGDGEETQRRRRT